MLLSVVSHTFGQVLAFVLQEQGPPMVQTLLSTFSVRCIQARETAFLALLFTARARVVNRKLWWHSRSVLASLSNLVCGGARVACAKATLSLGHQGRVRTVGFVHWSTQGLTQLKRQPDRPQMDGKRKKKHVVTT